MDDHYVPGFAPVLRFLRSQILCRVNKSPSNETVNEILRVHTYAKRSYTRVKDAATVKSTWPPPPCACSLPPTFFLFKLQIWPTLGRRIDLTLLQWSNLGSGLQITVITIFAAIISLFVLNLIAFHWNSLFHWSQRWKTLKGSKCRNNCCN